MTAAREPPELTIERLGTDGAGLARHEGAILAVPGALPGERVVVMPAERGKPSRLLRRLTDAAERVAPGCPHFGECGGCSLQHLARASYAEFKRRLVADALGRQGLQDVEVLPARCSPVSSRRRASLVARRAGARVLLGFHRTGSHEVVDVHTCDVLIQALADLLDPLRGILKPLLPPGQSVRVVMDATETGIDLGLALAADPGPAALQDLAEFADSQDLARIWYRTARGGLLPIAERRKPIVTLGGVAVGLPPGAFRQATAAGEQALVEELHRSVCQAARVADLFSGIGTFTLPLAPGRSVHAVESDEAACGALAAAVRRARLDGLTVERRNLEAKPLLARELARFEAVVFDPPRAGADAQSRELAQSCVPTVVGISCDPATFARDARTLVRGGYRLARVVPVDQFLWSSHVELVGTFIRA